MNDLRGVSMMKPTEHLQEALDAYCRDADHSTVVECVAHALSDVRAWAASIGVDHVRFPVALRRSLEIMHERAVKELDEERDSYTSCAHEIHGIMIDFSPD
jgi:hypothetical protein